MINSRQCVVLSIAGSLSVAGLNFGAIAQTENPDAAAQTQAVDPPAADLQATGINIKLDPVTEFAGNAQSNIQHAPVLGFRAYVDF